MPPTDLREIDHFLDSLFHDRLGASTPQLKRLFLVVTHPVRAWHAARYVRQFPVVNVAIPKSEAENAKWIFSLRRPWKLSNFISSYIELPTPLSLYWHGQAKQNVRKATARARKEGFTTVPVKPTEVEDVVIQIGLESGWERYQIESVILQVFKGSGWEFPRISGAICVAVVDENDRPVAFCLGAQAGNVVRNIWAYTAERGNVRWLCFSGYLEEVSARGARFIVESSPWALSEGNDVFAERLGFKPARIRNGEVA